MKKNTEALFQASKEICLEVNRKLSVWLSRYGKAGQNRNLLIANKSSKLW